MRTIQARSLTFAALALLAFTTGASAQDKAPVRPLNAAEVQQLVAHNGPADHARLSTHFAALADRYEAQAKLHASMSRAPVGNPSRNLAVGVNAHCKRLAELNTEAASVVRELQGHHMSLATGQPSVAPAAGAAFEAGAGATAATAQDLAKLAETARTPADHKALQTYFAALAKD